VHQLGCFQKPFQNWDASNYYGEICFLNGTRNIIPNYHIVDVDCFGDPILVVKDHKVSELTLNNGKTMITVVLPFAKVWPN